MPPPAQQATEYRIGYTSDAVYGFPAGTRYIGSYANVEDAIGVARHLSGMLHGVHVRRSSDGAVTPWDEYDRPCWTEPEGSDR